MKKIALTLTALAFLVATPALVRADEANPKMVEKKDAKAKPYPLETCVVSGEKLGEHGKPYVFTQDGQQVKLCCKDCLKEFKSEPAKYMKKIKEAQTRK